MNLDILTLVPLFTVHSFEVWRPITCVLVPPSLMTFVVVVYIHSGMQMERTLGSAKFTSSLVVLALYTNAFFLAAAIFLKVVTGDPSWLLAKTQGLLPCTLAVVTRMWAKSDNDRRLFFFNVKERYYTFAMTAMFSIIGGVQWGELCGCFMGWCVGNGVIKYSEGRVLGMAEEVLGREVRRRDGIWVEEGELLPTTQGAPAPAPAPSALGRGGGGPGNVSKPKFPGGGRALGS